MQIQKDSKSSKRSLDQLPLVRKEMPRTTLFNRSVVARLARKEIAQLTMTRERQRRKDTFVFNSQDEHIRKVLLQRGWVEDKLTSKTFRLKWSYSMGAQEYKLKDGQIVNHFKNNHELTTKRGLAINFKQAPYDLHVSDFFPDCFQLSGVKDQQQFSYQFNYGLLVAILKRTISFIQLRRRALVERLRQQLKEKRKPFKHVRKTNTLCLLAKNDDPQFCLNLFLTIQICKLARHLCKQWDLDEHQPKSPHIFEFRQEEFEQNLPTLLEWNRGSAMFSPIKNAHPLFSHQHYSTPSDFLVYKLIKFHDRLKQHQGPCWARFGLKNLWIVKPCENSKGSGVSLIDDKREAFENAACLGARVIQRYVERPLLLRQIPGLGKNYVNKKFDLRQWVLVTSVQPLVIYYFNECYLRFASEQYSLEELRPTQHLTNYSLNKEYFQEGEASVMSSQTFAQIIGPIRWFQIQRRNMNIVTKTLKACRNGMTQVKGCFQLYGFDLMVDQNYRTHLLEVNLTPACQQRASFLKHYLDSMARNLIRIVLGEDQDLSLYPKWLKIANEPCLGGPTQTKICNDVLSGTKLNTKAYIANQKYFLTQWAIRLQAWARMLPFRKQFVELKNAASKIQAWWRTQRQKIR